MTYFLVFILNSRSWIFPKIRPKFFFGLQYELKSPYFVEMKWDFVKINTASFTFMSATSFFFSLAHQVKLHLTSQQNFGGVYLLNQHGFNFQQWIIIVKFEIHPEIFSLSAKFRLCTMHKSKVTLRLITCRSFQWSGSNWSKWIIFFSGIEKFWLDKILIGILCFEVFW